MATGAKSGLAHRSKTDKAAPKKSEAKTLKRKRGQEDLAKLRDAVDQLVSAVSPFCRPQLSACRRPGLC
jgi:hypothetical protein